MAFIEKADSRDRVENILETAPQWLCDEISRRTYERTGEHITIRGVPNDQGSPEQLAANEHALRLRKLELLREEANELR